MNSTVSVHDLHSGVSLLWYRLERILRHDSSGVIYLATDTNLDRQVTIKEYIPGNIARRSNDRRVLPITEEHSDMYRSGLDQFIREGQTLHRFNHPNIVQVKAVFEENNTAYMVMELVEGVNLHSYLRKTKGVSEAALKSLVRLVAEGLAQVHHRGFIHSDINPWNIHVRSDGSPVLLDFGSNRITRKMTPQDPTLSTSACYEALEKFNLDTSAKQGPWTDIFALGGVLYFAISGVDPIDSRSRNDTMSNCGQDPLVLASVIGKSKYSKSFLNAVDWSLQLHIADRPKTLREWVTEGLFNEGWTSGFREGSRDAFHEEWPSIFDNTFSAPASTRHPRPSPSPSPSPSPNQDADATGQFNDKTYERDINATCQPPPSRRIIGFPIISIVTILILLVTIIATIVTSE